MTPLALVLAQETPDPKTAVVMAVSVPITFGLVVLAWIGSNKWGWKWAGIVCGVCIGVAGHSGFVGEIAWMLINIGIKLVKSIGDSSL